MREYAIEDLQGKCRATQSQSAKGAAMVECPLNALPRVNPIIANVNRCCLRQFNQRVPCFNLRVIAIKFKHFGRNDLCDARKEVVKPIGSYIYSKWLG